MTKFQAFLPVLAMTLFPAAALAEPPVPPQKPVDDLPQASALVQSAAGVKQAKAASPVPAEKPVTAPVSAPITAKVPENKPAPQLASIAGAVPLPGIKPAEPGPVDDFHRWLAALKYKLVAKGKFTPDFLDHTLAAVKLVPRVIELDKRQPEGTMTQAQYLERVVSANRIAEGRQRFDRNREVLAVVEKKYGVPAEVVTALWGIETSYGQITGGFVVLDALATLAYEGRRREFFEQELVNLLTIIEQEKRPVSSFLGSWAGAMGQSQFMPSSFLAYAVDHDGDGSRDIWGTQADVFASAANYLSRSGWKADERWGREVRLPDGFDRSLLADTIRKPVAAWQELGVRLPDGGDLPAAPADFQGRIIQPDGRKGRAFLVYRNFDVILRWNRSNYFATAVGILSDRIAATR